MPRDPNSIFTVPIISYRDAVRGFNSSLFDDKFYGVPKKGSASYNMIQDVRQGKDIPHPTTIKELIKPEEPKVFKKPVKEKAKPEPKKKMKAPVVPKNGLNKIVVENIEPRMSATTTPEITLTISQITINDIGDTFLKKDVIKEEGIEKWNKMVSIAKMEKGKAVIYFGINYTDSGDGEYLDFTSDKPYKIKEPVHKKSAPNNITKILVYGYDYNNLGDTYTKEEFLKQHSLEDWEKALKLRNGNEVILPTRYGGSVGDMDYAKSNLLNMLENYTTEPEPVPEPEPEPEPIPQEFEMVDGKEIYNDITWTPSVNYEAILTAVNKVSIYNKSYTKYTERKQFMSISNKTHQEQIDKIKKYIVELKAEAKELEKVKDDKLTILSKLRRKDDDMKYREIKDKGLPFVGEIPEYSKADNEYERAKNSYKYKLGDIADEERHLQRYIDWRPIKKYSFNFDYDSYKTEELVKKLGDTLEEKQLKDILNSRIELNKKINKTRGNPIRNMSVYYTLTDKESYVNIRWEVIRYKEGDGTTTTQYFGRTTTQYFGDDYKLTPEGVEPFKSIARLEFEEKQKKENEEKEIVIPKNESGMSVGSKNGHPITFRGRNENNGTYDNLYIIEDVKKLDDSDIVVIKKEGYMKTLEWKIEGLVNSENYDIICIVNSIDKTKKLVKYQIVGFKAYDVDFIPYKDAKIREIKASVKNREVVPPFPKLASRYNISAFDVPKTEGNQEPIKSLSFSSSTV